MSGYDRSIPQAQSHIHSLSPRAATPFFMLYLQTINATTIVCFFCFYGMIVQGNKENRKNLIITYKEEY